MPKGDPSKATQRVERYQKKAGYKAKTYKLKSDVAERFGAACAAAGESQASVIMRLMNQYIEQQSQANSLEHPARNDGSPDCEDKDKNETISEYDGYIIPERGLDTDENWELREKQLKEVKEQARRINAFYANRDDNR